MTAASLSLFSLLAGPLRAGRVLAIGPGVVHLELDPAETDEPEAGSEPAATVIALLEPDAVRLPFGLVLPAAAAGLVPVLIDGSPVSRGPIQLGWGALRLAGTRWPVLSWWNPSVPTLELPEPALTSAVATGPVGESLAGPPIPAELALGVAALGRGDPEDAVRHLSGVGPGLLPAGDAVLCGALAALACWAPDSPARRELVRAVATGTDTGRPIPAALLRSAAAGAVIPELSALLTAVGSGDQAGVDVTVRELARAARDSGTALAIGAVRQFQYLTRAARSGVA